MNLSEDYKELLGKMAFEFRPKRVKLSKEYSLLCPMIGRDYRPGGLLVFGRACNGWLKPWKVGEFSQEILKNMVAFSEEDQMDIFWAAFEKNSFSENEKKDLLERYKKIEGNLFWIINYLEGNPKTYKISPFWNVTEKIISELNQKPSNDGWAHQLVWSNVYKISPTKGDNPCASEIKSMEKISMDLVEMEIKELRPGLVLFLVDVDPYWFSPLKDRFNIIETGSNVVVGKGHFGDSKLLVTCRPENWKKSINLQNFVEETLRELKG